MINILINNKHIKQIKQVRSLYRLNYKINKLNSKEILYKIFYSELQNQAYLVGQIQNRLFKDISVFLFKK